MHLFQDKAGAFLVLLLDSCLDLLPCKLFHLSFLILGSAQLCALTFFSLDALPISLHAAVVKRLPPEPENKQCEIVLLQLGWESFDLLSGSQPTGKRFACSAASSVTDAPHDVF